MHKRFLLKANGHQKGCLHLRYRWFRLLGLSGMVRSMRFRPRAGLR